MSRSDGLPGRELLVGPIPKRKGMWLYTVNGPVVHTLAKFRDEDAVEEFFKWVTENEGKKLVRGEDD